MAIINGRRIQVPYSGMYGSDLIDAVGVQPGRRPVVNRGGTQFETVNPHKLYTQEDLLNKHRIPVKVTTIPDRSKGAAFGGPRSLLSKNIITEQVFDIAEKLFKRGVDFDEANADWMIVPNYKLPKIWSSIARFSPLLIIFPTEYPPIPPIGFYLKAKINFSPNGHLFDQAFHNACKDPIKDGWKWYCVYVKPGCWRPARYIYPGDWRKGDNLWTYFQLIDEALATTGN